MSGLGFILFAFSVFLSFAFGVAAARLARIDDLGGFIVATLLAAAAQIVLISELLSLVSLWKQVPLVLFQIVLLAAVAIASHRFGQSSAVTQAIRSWLVDVRALRFRDLARHPATTVLAVFISMMLLAELVLAFKVAPNNWDSMTYHLTRIVYWIQNASIEQFPGATERQAVYPINGEVLQGWTMLMTSGDRFAQLLQWTAQLGLVAFVFAAVRDLGHTTRAGFFAAAAMVAMPVFVTQATSTQNDMILAFFVAAALLFLLRAVDGDKRAAVVAGVAFGLAIGTKSSALIFSFAVVIAALVVAGRNWRRLLLPAACAVVGTLLLGTFNYVQNVTERGSVIASPASDTFRVKSVKEVPMNSVNVLWSSTMTFPGVSFGTFEPVAERGVRSTFGRVAARIQTAPWPDLKVRHSAHEDEVGTGLPALLLILPALAFTLIRRRPFEGELQRKRAAYALAAIGSLFLVCLTLLSNAWIGRFAVTPAALAIPLVAIFAYREALRTALVIVVVLSMTTVTLQAALKPLVVFGGSSVLSMDRVFQQSIFGTSEATPAIAVEQSVPLEGRLGIVGAEDSWEYQYAGANLQRTLVKVDKSVLTPEVFDTLDLDALIVLDNAAAPEGFGKPVYADPAHSLFLRPPADAATPAQK